MGWGYGADTVTQEPESAFCYVILTMGELRLVIPQNQIYALEPTIDVTNSASDGEVGHISIDDTSWPVYCLSSHLTPLREVPASRHICVLLYKESGLFGVLCDQVILAEWPNGIDLKLLPECMRTPNAKVKGLLLQGEDVLCMVLAEDLLTCCEVRHHTEGSL